MCQKENIQTFPLHPLHTRLRAYGNLYLASSLLQILHLKKAIIFSTQKVARSSNDTSWPTELLKTSTCLKKEKQARVQKCLLLEYYNVGILTSDCGPSWFPLLMQMESLAILLEHKL